MKHLNQSGVGAIEALLLVVIIAIIGGAGWFVWHNNQSSKNTPTSANQNNATPVVASTTCQTVVNNSETSPAPDNNWKDITHTNVELSDWKVSLTLPADLVNKTVCKQDSDVKFSTKAIISDVACVNYYANEELGSADVSLLRLAATDSAWGQGTGSTGTLEDYYKDHGAPGTNYFTEPSSGRKYYKVGNYFYVMEGDATGVLDAHKAARIAACKSEKPDFRQPFVDAMASLKSL